MIDKKIKIIAAVIIVAAVIGIAGIVVGNKATTQEEVIKNEKKASPQKEVVTIKVGGYGSTTDGIIAPKIGEELGYYDGITIENANVPDALQAVVALSTGQVDVTTHATFLSIIRAVAKGAKIKVVALSHGPSAKHTGLFVLSDSPIKSAKDLKGKKIGGGNFVLPGQSGYLLIAEYLKPANLSIKNDVDIVTIPSGQEVPALLSKQVDVIWGSHKTYEILKENGYEGRYLFEINDLILDWHHCGFIVTEKFIQEKPELLRNLVGGFVKGVDWERDNPEKAKELHMAKGRDPEAVRKYYSPTDIRKHALVQDGEIQFVIDYLVRTGELKEGQVKPSDIYTNEFNPYYTK